MIACHARCHARRSWPAWLDLCSWVVAWDGIDPFVGAAAAANHACPVSISASQEYCRDARARALNLMRRRRATPAEPDWSGN